MIHLIHHIAIIIFQITTHIIHIDSHTKKLDSLLPKDSCIELDSEANTCQIPLPTVNP